MQTFTGVYSVIKWRCRYYLRPHDVECECKSCGMGAHAIYYAISNLLFLENDSGTGLSVGITPGSTAQVSNSQCTLFATGSSASISGDALPC